jgi:methionyl-tRNA formyltransferase
VKTVVGFLSRSHGFNILSGLINSEKYDVKSVYTHSLKPKSEDPNRSKRDDYDLFVKTCSENSIPLETVDSKQQKIQDCPNCDFIVEASWRYLIPDSITSIARIAAFGIHRGKLPDYGGAEPIKQALLKNEKEIILSGHYLSSKIDKGDTIATISHPTNYNPNNTFEENIQRLRDEITPLFSQLMFKTFEILLSK